MAFLGFDGYSPGLLMVLLMPRRILQHSGLKLDIHQLHQKVVSTHLTAARVTWFFL